MRKTAFWTIALCGLCTMMEAAHSKPPAVVVTTEDYQGWTQSYRLTNGIVDAVVVPQIGRVMAFELTGKPETSPIWQNDALAGKERPADAETNWANFGGDKLWLSPQGDWGKRAPKVWPPEAAVDSGPFTAANIANGVKLTGPISPSFGGRFVREITLTPGKAEIKLRDTFEKTQGDAFPLGLWSVTQVKSDSTIFLPQNPRSIFGEVGMTSLTDRPELSANAKTADGFIVMTHDPNSSTKIGADTTGGWMACVRSDVLFSEQFTRPRGDYPDKNSNAEVYTNPGDLAYTEMEILAPLAALKPGQKMTRTMTWRLQMLPRVPTDEADARFLVKAAMSGK